MGQAFVHLLTDPWGGTILRIFSRAASVAALILAVSMGFSASLATAQTAPDTAQNTAQITAPARLLFVGASADEQLNGPIPPALSVLSLPSLPQPADAEIAALSSMLRANPVSTFEAPSSGPYLAQTGALYLVTDFGLTGGQTTQIEMGDQSFGLDDLGSRLSALLAAFEPAQRAIGFFRIDDPQDLLPVHLPQLRQTIDAAGFGVAVIMVYDQACTHQRLPLHYTVLAGLADRLPMGNGDGRSDSTEVQNWLGRALTRDTARQTSGHCAAAYSLIISADAPDAALVQHSAEPLFPQITAAFELEYFEALFLVGLQNTAAEQPIDAYLAACTYCPFEPDLRDLRRQIVARQQTAAMEQVLWQRIGDDTDPARLEVYLLNCSICAFSDDAHARLDRLDEIASARVAETAAFDEISAAGDIIALRDWVQNCTACLQKDAALSQIDALEADEIYQAEQTALNAALSAQNPRALAAWLAECTLCGGAEDAQAALTQIEAQNAAAGPCLAAAGLPQQGGPRLLSEIDATVAAEACGQLGALFPGNGTAATLLARIAQAQGDAAAALTGYEAGMHAGYAPAFGLAAHAAYAPETGEADYALAATLAEAGYARGDWLSGEVLTVMYSRGLTPGKGAPEAFAVAEDHGDQGNHAAQFFTGFFHLSGIGTPASPAEAERWLRRATDGRYARAYAFLAGLYEDGATGITRDDAQAAELYWAGLIAGDATALERLTTQLSDRNRNVVRMVQTKLAAAGVFRGRVDGISGPNTLNAVQTYARQIAEE